MDEVFQNLHIRMSPARYGVVLAAALVCGATDLWRFRVYNAVTIPLLIGGLVFHTCSPGGERVGFAVVGAILGGLLLLPFCALGGVGAGDVKLLAGIGAWIGAYDVLVVFVVTGLLVGLYSLAVIALTAEWRTLPARLKQLFLNPAALRHALGRRRDVDDAAQDPHTARRRLAPMAALMACALMLLMVSHWFRGSS